MTGRRHVIMAMACLFCTCFMKAQQDTVFPAPYGNPNQLFYLQRTPDANTVVYEVNFKNGELNKADPVHAFWIRYTDSGRRAELNSIQRRFAYGIKARAISAEVFELQFVSNKTIVMYLKKGMDQKYCVYTLINRKLAILIRVFVKISGGSFWSPKIEYVDLKGNDPVSGLVVRERVKIIGK